MLSPCTLKARLRHVAFRIEVAVERPAGRKAVDQLDAADLDQPVALDGVEAGGFGVEHDLAHRTFASAASESISPGRHLSNRRQDLPHLLRGRARCPAPLSTTKSARRRFSASGICRASSASSRSRLTPRSSTRARCISGGADTTTVASTRPSPPVSNSSGMSSTTTGAPWRSRLVRGTSSRTARTSGCTIASRRCSAGGIAEHAAGPAPRDRPCRPCVAPGNAASISGAASPS